MTIYIKPHTDTHTHTHTTSKNIARLFTTLEVV